MNLKDQILFEVHGNIKKVSSQEEEKLFSSFVETFLEDAQEFGLTEATEMYGILFGKDASVLLETLKEGFEEILKNPLNEADYRNSITKLIGSNWRNSATPTAVAKWAGDGVAGAGALGTKAAITSAAAFDKAKEGIAGAGALGTKAATTSGGLAGIWNSIKGFFKGGWESIKNAFKTGNFSGLLSTPLIQGALATGGVVLAIKLLKKIFGKSGKKMTPEMQAKIQEQMQAKLDAKKAENK